MSNSDTTDLLDILEAVTEIRVANPEMRSAALTTMRLLTSNGFLIAGRIYSIRADDSISSIISHGDLPISSEEEEALARKVWGGETVELDGMLIRHWPVINCVTAWRFCMVLRGRLAACWWIYYPMACR